MALTLTRGTTRARPHCTYCLKTVITKAWRGREHTGDGRVGPVTWGSFRWEARNRKGASRERCTRGRGERPGRDAVAPSVTKQLYLQRTRRRYCRAIIGVRCRYKCTRQGPRNPVTIGTLSWKA